LNPALLIIQSEWSEWEQLRATRYGAATVTAPLAAELSEVRIISASSMPNVDIDAEKQSFPARNRSSSQEKVAPAKRLFPFLTE
jgi:hypothetical protein